MTQDQLVAELKRRYATAPEGDKVVSIHLFGIAFAEALEGHSLASIAEAATGNRSYGTEIRKAVNLAKHVVLK